MNGSGLLGLIIALMWLALPLLRVLGRTIGQRGGKSAGEGAAAEGATTAAEPPRRVRVIRPAEGTRAAQVPLRQQETVTDTGPARMVFSSPPVTVATPPLQRPTATPPVRPAPRLAQLSELQRAVVYAEIIGPPVSLRGPVGQE